MMKKPEKSPQQTAPLTTGDTDPAAVPHTPHRPAKAVLSIETTRYSAVVSRILAAYRGEVTVRIDGRSFKGGMIDDLLHDWCTNRTIRNTINFEVSRGDVPIFGFQNHPDELWAAASEEAFIASLANEGLLRFRRSSWETSLT